MGERIEGIWDWGGIFTIVQLKKISLIRWYLKIYLSEMREPAIMPEGMG